MKYYVCVGEAPPYVCGKPEIFESIKAGKVTPATPACPVGATAWSTLGQLVPELFQPGAVPPEESGVAEIVGKAGHFIAEHSGEVAGLARLFARRILVSNFTAENASPEERKQLEAAALPVRSPMAQNYAAWRRAMLWFAGIGIAIATVLQAIDVFGSIFGRHIPFIMRLMNFGLVALPAASAALILFSALRWAEISRSRRMARWGWILGFFGPLLLFLLPLQKLGSDREWVTFAMAQNSPDQATQVQQLTDADITRIMTSPDGKMMVLTLGAVFAAAALLLLVPRVFGLFPGIIRACMTLRTLVPESPLPGYVAAVITPLYAVLLLVIMGLASQVGSGPLFFGLVALICSPLLVMKNLRTLAQPLTPEQMNAHLRPLRVKMSIATGIGVLCILAALGEHWEQLRIEADSVASVVCQLFGNIFVLTVVSADFLLSLMRFSFDQDKALSGTPLYTSMEQRYADLSQVKFTQFVDDTPAAPPPPIPPSAPASPTAPV